MTKDYYKILDIEEFSTQDEIKCAYRKLARKWHPDVAGNSPDIIAKFKEINEAYEILSNSVKKSDYDKAWEDPDAYWDSGDSDWDIILK